MLDLPGHASGKGGPPMDLDLTRRRRGVQAAGARLARRARARRAAPLPGDRGGLRRPPGVGAHARGGPLVGGLLARGVRRPGRRHRQVAGVRGGVLRGGRARAGSRRTASTSSRPTLFDHGTDEQRARVLPPMATRRGRSGRRPGRSRSRAPTWRRCARPPVARDGGWLLSGQKTWSSRAAFADRAFGLFRSGPGAPTREAAPGADLPDVRPRAHRA